MLLELDPIDSFGGLAKIYLVMTLTQVIRPSGPECPVRIISLCIP
jgi:hypothetical protein